MADRADSSINPETRGGTLALLDERYKGPATMHLSRLLRKSGERFRPGRGHPIGRFILIHEKLVRRCMSGSPDDTIDQDVVDVMRGVFEGAVKDKDSLPLLMGELGIRLASIGRSEIAETIAKSEVPEHGVSSWIYLSMARYSVRQGDMLGACTYVGRGLLANKMAAVETLEYYDAASELMGTCQSWEAANGHK